ncbi:thiamine-phosphate pyrophosphorylase [Granulicella pectinivorans]|jgi:thiamine-phosphate pyrophosphorylase|uniref:Thiamine-phosphate synthase n=1 Tax=Granulicella pectinivorans TaxID=474950 RepID=A0A1I6MMU3_9BACT|nr:thiamine phosphate synthase [Granulicella pectinivorans]SFS17013.1 thiamine-phosphate pyrophosphorylase [Granulicella pectinivorans]
MIISRLYAIVDVDVLRAHGCRVRSFGEEMRRAGVGLVQYRNKNGTPEDMLRDAAILREVFAGTGATLLMNDRADLAALAGWDGVHVGQGDLAPADARMVAGAGSIVGISTHVAAEIEAASASCADYVAIGPVFATGTKLDASPVVGLEGVRRARMLTRKPLVAIGGITRANARSVIDAGADAVAVISGLIVKGECPGRIAEEFLELLR